MVVTLANRGCARLLRVRVAADAAHRKEWYAHLATAHLSLRSLARVGMMAEVAPPAGNTLKAALAAADVAVTVQRIHTTQSDAVPRWDRPIAWPNRNLHQATGETTTRPTIHSRHGAARLDQAAGDGTATVERA